jgi:hypothetical protein
MLRRQRCHNQVMKLAQPPLAAPARLVAGLLGLAAGRAVPEPAATPDRAVTRVIRGGRTPGDLVPRRTSNSASLDAAERPSRASQLQSRAKIR